jgi:hypothetical protein
MRIIGRCVSGIDYDDFTVAAQWLQRQQTRGDVFFIQSWDDDREFHWSKK